MSSDAHYSISRRRPLPSALVSQQRDSSELGRLLAWEPMHEPRHRRLATGTQHFPPFALDAAAAAQHDLQTLEVEEYEGLIDRINEGWRQVPLEWTSIEAPEHLIPPYLYEDTDALPSEQHPSYPFGDLFARSRVPYASEPKLVSPTHPHRTLPKTSAPPDLTDADVFGPYPSHDPTDTPAGPLPSRLALDSRVTEVSAQPVWPFTRYGPGRGGHAALLYADRVRPARPTREVWADMGLGTIYPQGQERDPLSRGVAREKDLKALSKHPAKLHASAVDTMLDLEPLPSTSAGGSRVLPDEHAYGQRATEMRTALQRIRTPAENAAEARADAFADTVGLGLAERVWANEVGAQRLRRVTRVSDSLPARSNEPGRGPVRWGHGMRIGGQSPSRQRPIQPA